MKLEKVHINNYRIFNNTDISFDDLLTIIVGKNNTGKTSLKIILDRFLNSNQGFSFNDLNLDLQKFLIESTEQNYKKYIKNEDIEFKTVGITLSLFISYNEQDNLTNISPYITDLDISTNKIIATFSYALDKEHYLLLLRDYKNLKEKFKKIKTSNDIPKIDFILNKSLRSYFTRISYITPNANDAEIDYFYQDENTIYIGKDFNKILNYEYISAERDVLNTDGLKSASVLSSLAYKYWNIKKDIEHESEDLINSETALMDNLINTDKKLSRVYKKVFENVVEDIKTISNSKDKLIVQSSLQEKNILEQNTQIFYSNDGYKLPEDYNGLGYMNLYEIIFKLELAKKKFETGIDGELSNINLLFIEEPEAHLHPQMQYVFIKNIKNLLRLNNDAVLQTIITTHSSNIVSNIEFNHFRYFLNKDNNIFCKNLIDLKSSDDDFLRRYLTLSNAELFFADKIILIEGDTERLLINSFMQKMSLECSENEIPLINQNVSIVEVGSCANIFKPLLDFLEIKTLIITDIDYVKKTQTKNGQTVYNSCSYKQADSCNPTIRDLLNSSDISMIKKLPQSKRLINKNLLLSYQQCDNRYYARSFEDSFICRNYSFIKANIDKIDLKNKTYFDKNNGIYEITQKCINKKTSFALSIIKAVDHLDEIFIPKYIEEGLKWLQQ